MTAATLLAFLLIWHEYLMQSLAYVWLPTLLDSMVPFAFLVVELFMAHLVFGSQRIWLLVTGIGFVVGLISWQTTRVQARTHAAENRGILGAVADTSRVRINFNILPCVHFLGGWALDDVLHLTQVRFFVALLAALLVAVRIAATVPYWKRVLNYAHSESKPAR